MAAMEPLPETRRAIDELELDPAVDPALDADPDDVLDQLVAAGREVRRIVPDCLGLSLCHLRDGIVLTLVASDADVTVLDAVQYLAGGPCVEAVAEESVREETAEDVLDEDRWQLFARASAARAVRSSLTLPILDGGRVVGSINLYGASGNAFTGHHEELAEVFGAWAPGAVANADLSFRTRLEAQRAPERIAEQRLVDTAVGVVSEQSGIDVDAARARLVEAAARAGVPVAELAEAVLEALHDRPDTSGGTEGADGTWPV
ncbi:GAF and ANTAR domain-containing protein [Nocardioides sp. SOB77]|uniref:GAF and ANTAR domain-containing protein n=1 Tax=Nocardioides oceani TaxID=3058369 RepID=A0ABT8FAZ1_9ACTN|nr:GAF and ANTAR domain-containing protein [Nocardioides oceani]MDN4171859.1 GAF and ANTAR domain-containing protein [Nocardioides oceani]